MGVEKRDMMSVLLVWGLALDGVGARKSRSNMLEVGAAVAAGGWAPVVAAGAWIGDVAEVGRAVASGGA